WHVREHADPDPAAALHVARDGAPRRLDLARGHAAAVGGLEAVLAEGHGIPALRAARDPALELLAELGPLRLHHVSLPNVQPAGGAAGSAALAPAAVAAAGAAVSAPAS